MITCMLLFNILWCLLGGFNPEAQAKTLLKLPTETQPQLYNLGLSLTFDATGNLWVLANWERDLCISMIKQNGTLELDKILIHEMSDEYPRYMPGHDFISDRYGNTYFCISPSQRDGGIYYETSTHLFQVSPWGDVNNFYPWPKLETYGSFIEILPEDTLLILGRDYRVTRNQVWGGRIVKALLDSSGITPVYERTYAIEEYPQRMINVYKTFRRVFFDWERGYGFFAEFVTWSDAGTEELILLRFDLKGSGNSIPQDSVGRFRWRDYIWRTYENTWIDRMTFEQYKGSGYLLYFPDPEDVSITQVLRLDNLGEPIDPSTLTDGGLKEPLNFNRIPESVKRYADLDIWKKPLPKEIVRDSAQVLFWGCDNEGNLYSYKKLKTYGSRK